MNSSFSIDPAVHTAIAIALSGHPSTLLGLVIRLTDEAGSLMLLSTPQFRLVAYQVLLKPA